MTILTIDIRIANAARRLRSASCDVSPIVIEAEIDALLDRRLKLAGR